MPKPFKPMKARFRATFGGSQLGAGRLGSVDKENEILHDVQITLEGEAKGHGVWLDREFCEAVAAQGNATGDVGLKVRYGHPAMCSDAIGTELARAKNFRVVDVEREIDGQKVTCAGVVADVHMLEAAHSAPQGDIVKHVMEMAATDPSQFGQSIVFTYADWVVKDADGVRHSFNDEVQKPYDEWHKENPEAGYLTCAKKADELREAWLAKSADSKVYAVLGKLHGTDFTDSPAATDGIFSTGTLAEEAELMLSEHPQIIETLEKSPKALVEFLARTGLDKRLESARVAGLQAAKDKELAELRAEFEDYKKRSIDALAAAEAQAKEQVAALSAQVDELRTSNETLTSDIAEKTDALAKAQTEVEQLKSKVGETEKALSETKAALQVEIERYREQVGAALQQKPDAPMLRGSAAVAASVRIV